MQEPIILKKFVSLTKILIILDKYIKNPVIILINNEINIFFKVDILVFFIPSDNPRTILSIFAEITNTSDDIKLVKTILLSITNILNEITSSSDTNCLTKLLNFGII